MPMFETNPKHKTCNKPRCICLKGILKLGCNHVPWCHCFQYKQMTKDTLKFLWKRQAIYVIFLFQEAFCLLLSLFYPCSEVKS